MPLTVEIEFEELKLEIAPKVFLPVSLNGSAMFHFDKFGELQTVDGIFLPVEGFHKQFWLREGADKTIPQNVLASLVTKALEKDDLLISLAWEQTGETVPSQQQQHGTY